MKYVAIKMSSKQLLGGCGNNSIYFELRSHKINQEHHSKETQSSHNTFVAHFHVFGCLAFIHIPIQRQMKLDTKSQLCILVGYSNATKGYRCYNPSTKNVFDEGRVCQQKNGVQKNILIIMGIEDGSVPPPHKLKWKFKL